MKSESIIQQEILLEAAKYGIKLMRNNSGALMDSNGRMVRYGLDNISKTHNAKFKSSDLIGIIPPSGRFIAIECKREGWKFNQNDTREQAQAAFIHYIVSHGGVAGFCSSVIDFLNLLNKS